MLQIVTDALLVSYTPHMRTYFYIKRVRLEIESNSFPGQAAANSCVDAIIEVSGAHIVQERTLIEITQRKPEMERAKEFPLLDQG